MFHGKAYGVGVRVSSCDYILGVLPYVINVGWLLDSSSNWQDEDVNKKYATIACRIRMFHALSTNNKMENIILIYTRIREYTQDTDVNFLFNDRSKYRSIDASEVDESAVVQEFNSNTLMKLSLHVCE